MVRIGGFIKTQNRIQRQRARGRFISPYQVGGMIFGKSIMARHPLMYTSSRLLEPWGPFLEIPGNFKGPKSNIQNEI